MLRKFFLILFITCCGLYAIGQQGVADGIITGNLITENQKPVEAATIQLKSVSDSLKTKNTLSDKNGEFGFTTIDSGFYKLIISFSGLQTLTIDSIHFRPDRNDFNFSDIILKEAVASELEAVIVYAEKPLIVSKDGNITFNVGESALAAGSNAADLLNNVPLVAKDPDGKITVRGKEPKILIDDKPVELNLQQLQDLLESLPGSSIEKIEVMTNPPPQYANEQGGVINIVTKKGKVGKNARLSLSVGTRGEGRVNGSFSYRKNKLALNINAGGSYNVYDGDGYSNRKNIYADSANFFKTNTQNTSRSYRPNLRASMDYDFNKNNFLNLTLNYNQNDYNNNSTTEYQNINSHEELWKLSKRQVESTGDNFNPSLVAAYTWKGKPGEQLKIITSYNFSSNNGKRNFFQQYYHPDYSETGIDSTQQQINDASIHSYSGRINYDKMLSNKKTFLSFGTAYNRNDNNINVDASFKKKPEGTMVRSDLLSNEFTFHQTISNFRASVRQQLGSRFSITAGTSLESTAIWFELLKENKNVKNNYWTWLPFANISRNWKEQYNVSLAYRRSIRRPGINELNPTIDFADPYNLRFGNEKLVASTAHNFDLVAGRTKAKYFVNFGAGYNIVQDIFSQVRSLMTDGRTQITWENISGRKEYELSTWNGITIHRKVRANASASFTYSKYSDFDKLVRRFRNGGSFTSNVNVVYSPNDKMNLTGGFNINRFGNPQGFARWNTSMNLGLQQKFMQKRLTATINIIDPLVNQQRRVFTTGPNFSLESYSLTRTRNLRLSIAYNLIKPPKKKNIPQLNKALGK